MRGAGLATWCRQLATRAAASDPGLVRLSSAITTVATLTVSLAALYGATSLAGQPFTVAMLGVVVSMISSMAFKGPRPAQRVILAAAMLAVASTAVTLGAVLAPHKVGGDVVFVVIMAAATAGRRFGPQATTVGMVGFMTYFFALFLGATLTMLPWLIIALVIGTAISLGMSLVLRDHPGRRARRSLRALDARLRLFLDAVVDSLASGPVDDRRRRRLTRRLDEVSQTSLMVDGLLDDPDVGGVPGGPDAETLKAGLFDLELAAEALGRTCLRAGAEHRPAADHPGELVAAVAAVRASLSGDGSERACAAEGRAERMATDPATPAPYRPVARSLAALARAVDHLRAPVESVGGQQPPPGAGEPPASNGTDGSSQDADGAEMDPPAAASGQARLSPSTRQAVQVTIATSLAIVAGELLSSARWYWAVIAAFVIYSGTTSRGEVLAKGRQRILGTVVGVMVGAVIASLVSGNVVVSLVLIFVSLFIGFYLMQVSYVFMVVGTTTMLALLYGLLGEFSASLLVTRIEETAIGAAIGILTALVVAPTRTSSTVNSSVRSYLAELGDLIEAAGANLAGTGGENLTSRSRTLDRGFAAVRNDAKPLTAGLLSMRGRASATRALRILASCEHYARSLARVGQSASDLAAQEALRRACSRVKDDVTELADRFDHRPHGALEPADDPLDAAQTAIDAGPPQERERLTVALGRLRQIDVAVITLAHDLASSR